MSQSNTPAWGTPTVTGRANPTAETQVMPPISSASGPSDAVLPPHGPTGPSREMVELRVTAVHYAQKVLGDQPIANADTKIGTVLRVAERLERYLLTGNTSGI